MSAMRRPWSHACCLSTGTLTAVTIRRRSRHAEMTATLRTMEIARRPMTRCLVVVVLLLGLVAVGELTTPPQARADVPPLPAGTLCQGPQASQPASGPTHVINIV